MHIGAFSLITLQAIRLCTITSIFVIAFGFASFIMSGSVLPGGHQAVVIALSVVIALFVTSAISAPWRLLQKNDDQP